MHPGCAKDFGEEVRRAVEDLGVFRELGNRIEGALQLDHLGDPVDAAILQADHPEYLALTPADLPGVRAFVDGRGVIDAANWPGVTFLRLGDGEA